LPDISSEKAAHQSPEGVAHKFGIVERRNFFAHTIREIALAILQTQHRHYQILTIMRDEITVTKTHFRESCCEIFVAPIPEDKNESRLRLTLAHELGHLIYNLEQLDEVTDSSKAHLEEEIWAWKFAYALAIVKSREHKTNKDIGKFVYDPRQLQAILLSHLKDKKPDVHEVLKDSTFAVFPD